MHGGGRGGAGPGGSGTDASCPGVRRGRVECVGGGPAFGSVRAEQSRRHADDPGPDARGGTEREMAGDLAGRLRHEEGGGADEAEDHMAGGPIRVASHSTFCTAASRAPTATSRTGFVVREAAVRDAASPASIPSTTPARTRARAAYGRWWA